MERISRPDCLVISPLQPLPFAHGEDAVVWIWSLSRPPPSSFRSRHPFLRLAKGQQRSLEEQIRAAGLEELLILEGRVDNVPAFLESYDLVVHSSHSEGCPNAVMEARACGRPVVATDVGDVRDLVEDGLTGSVVAPGDEVGLCAAVEQLIREPERRLRMGRTARGVPRRRGGLRHFCRI